MRKVPKSHQLFGRAVIGLPIIAFMSCVVIVLGINNAQSNSSVGEWSAVENWPIVAVHTMMLRTGKVLFFSYADDAHLWDPANNSFTTLPLAGYNLFCSAQSHASNGRILVSGGHIQNNVGENKASYFDPVTNTWTPLPVLNAGRWYPTNTTLSNGNVLVTSGDVDHYVNELPQVWQVSSSTWRNLTSANLALTLYPAAFLAPNGRVFFATSTSRYLNTAGTGSWSTVANRLNGGRDNFGSACMYDDGKVIYTGGSDPPTNTCEAINLYEATPSWSYVAPMPQVRRQQNVTILPDGTLLVTGGSSSSGFNTDDGPKAALMYNPDTNVWSTMVQESDYRGYHSTAILLPDGRVLSAGGDNHPNAQIYSPPYLFLGARPTITSVPTAVGQGKTFFVGTPDAASIARVSLIRMSAVTHTKNMDQRISRLIFSQATGGINVTLPSRGYVCPPGYYMLFIINSAGVPSVAPIIKVTISSGSFKQSTDPDGLVSMDAESFDTYTIKGGRSWIGNRTTGYSGTGALQAMPNTGVNNTTGYTSTSPRLNFTVKFNKIGTHYIWIRGIGLSGTDDSCHVGLDGEALSTSDHITGFGTDWTWSKNTMDGIVASFDVATAGTHTVNLWMREDGFIIDKIVLTTDSAYVPSGLGPPQSPR